jgi:hypothetical protein
MIYRCDCPGTQCCDDSSRWTAGAGVPTTYDFYLELKSHVEGVEKVYGESSRAGVFLGIFNCTCYKPDSEIYEYGKYIGMGYDVLVRDLLITKHFGIPKASLFMLHSEGGLESSYCTCGLFDTYGDDILDRLNASVNGPQSVESFDIPQGSIAYSELGFGFVMYIFMIDFYYNLGRWWNLGLLVGIIGVYTALYWGKKRNLEK